MLLAVIGLQAAQPVHAPLERTTGSAFSASTVDVALTTTRRDEAARAQPVPLPALPTPQPAARPVLASELLDQPAHWLPDVRGPPPRASSIRLPDLRGPPLA
jgi:hypothetical protein